MNPETDDEHEVKVSRGDLDALRATISFLSSVIRCREPYTPDVAQAVDNAFTRLSRMSQDD